MARVRGSTRRMFRTVIGSNVVHVGESQSRVTHRTFHRRRRSSAMETVLARADSAFVDEQYDEALALYTKACTLGPLNAHLCSKRAVSFLKLHRWSDALSDAEKGLGIDPNNALLQLRKGSVLLNSLFIDAGHNY
jgi:tetratricopeptide (TPR) repeat protein